MGTTRKPVPITHDELQVAIRKFQKSGGIIQKLPDQKAYAHHAVGSQGDSVDASSKPDPTL